MPRNWRITKNLLCRRWLSSTLKYDELSTQQKENLSIVNQLSGIARQSEFHERCWRIRWSWNCEQLWSIPRSQSTHECSESRRFDKPRFLIAACYTEPIAHDKTRFWRSTCSRWTILSTREFKECGIDFLQIEDKWCRQILLQRTVQHQLLALAGTLRPGTLCIVPKELILKIVWLKFRGILSRNCISENSKTQWTSGRSISRPEYALVQVVRVTRCCGSKKQRWQISGRSHDGAVEWRVRIPDFWDDWCEDCVCVEDDHLRTSDGELTRRSKKLKHKTDFFEEDRLRTRSTNISGLLALMKLLLILQIHSVSPRKATTLKILIQEGTKLYCRQVKGPKIMSWKVCVQLQRWPSMTKKDRAKPRIRHGRLWCEDTLIRWSRRGMKGLRHENQ